MRATEAGRAVSPGAWILALSGTICLAIFSMPGCGEQQTGLVLTIESSYQVPSEVDRLSVLIEAAGFPEKLETFNIDSPFPHTLSIELSSDGSRLAITVAALKGQSQVNAVRVEVRPVPGKVVGAHVVL